MSRTCCPDFELRQKSPAFVNAGLFLSQLSQTGLPLAFSLQIVALVLPFTPVPPSAFQIPLLHLRAVCGWADAAAGLFRICRTTGGRMSFCRTRYTRHYNNSPRSNHGRIALCSSLQTNRRWRYAAGSRPCNSGRRIKSKPKFFLMPSMSNTPSVSLSISLYHSVQKKPIGNFVMQFFVLSRLSDR